MREHSSTRRLKLACGRPATCAAVPSSHRHPGTSHRTEAFTKAGSRSRSRPARQLLRSRTNAAPHTHAWPVDLSSPTQLVRHAACPPCMFDCSTLDDSLCYF
jgi:hypothetical protein